MLTDFPISDFGSSWSRLRGSATSANPLVLWQSQYAPLAALNRTAGTSAEELDRRLKNDFSEVGASFVERDGYPFAPLNTTAVRHSFFAMPPQDLAALGCAKSRWLSGGRRELSLARETAGSVFVLQPALPGWCALLPGSARLQPLQRHTPVSSTLDLAHPLPAGSRIELVYAPFCFRLGLFLTLCTLALIMFCRLGKHGLTHRRVVTV
jgi:hypothetical protein